jgi:(carboxyethyl)arginine beta-lactam-synthase
MSDTTRPAITGFSIGTGPVMPPVLTAAGRLVPLTPAGRGQRWRGWALVPPGPGAGTAEAGGTAIADGVTVLISGELYHRGRLRAAIGNAAAGVSTDAELLLACWLRYGLSGLRLLNGRFAAAIADGELLVAATDHAGSVPLYLRGDATGVRLATEAKALTGAGPDCGGLPGTDPTEVPGVRRVRAGTAITIAPGGTVSAIRTWRPPEHRVPVDPDAAVRDVAVVLREAVRTRLDADHRRRVTVVLSGGIDSSSVAALSGGADVAVDTVALGTDAGDEFDAARLVATHLHTTHAEFWVTGDELVRQLPWAVAAAEITDPDVLEYLLPLVVLYRTLPSDGRRILTGYGADIPLGGMHRGTSGLAELDAVIAHDMATFDGLNELSPVLGAVAGHWTTHPYWDRDVLDLLVRLEPGLKHRHGADKWGLREAMRVLLPPATVSRSKLGIHEGAGVTSIWTAALTGAGVSPADVPAAKKAMAAQIHRLVVRHAVPPTEVSFDSVLHTVASGRTLAVAR